MKETQSLKDAVKTYRAENEDLRMDNSKKNRALQELRTSEENKRRMVIMEMTEKHGAETEKIESLYRKRLEVESCKFKDLEHAKDDAVFSMEEKMLKVQHRNDQEKQKLHESYRVAIDNPGMPLIGLLPNRVACKKSSRSTIC